jgi:Xaa-Pro aminopeptidase
MEDLGDLAGYAPGRQRQLDPSRRYLRLDRDLQAGMVVTIEPGAYVPGFGCVRIEDDVLVTAEGCEVLTTVGRDLLVC